MQTLRVLKSRCSHGEETWMCKVCGEEKVGDAKGKFVSKSLVETRDVQTSSGANYSLARTRRVECNSAGRSAGSCEEYTLIGGMIYSDPR